MAPSNRFAVLQKLMVDAPDVPQDRAQTPASPSMKPEHIENVQEHEAAARAADEAARVPVATQHSTSASSSTTGDDADALGDTSPPNEEDTPLTSKPASEHGDKPLGAGIEGPAGYHEWCWDDDVSEYHDAVEDEHDEAHIPKEFLVEARLAAAVLGLPSTRESAWESPKKVAKRAVGTVKAPGCTFVDAVDADDGGLVAAMPGDEELGGDEMVFGDVQVQPVVACKKARKRRTGAQRKAAKKVAGLAETKAGKGAGRYSVACGVVVGVVVLGMGVAGGVLALVGSSA